MKASYVIFKRVVKRQGSVPIHVAAADASHAVNDSLQAALALSALVPEGECGLRSLKMGLCNVPILPASDESSGASLPDLLPFHPRLVLSWATAHAINVNISSSKQYAVLLSGVVDAFGYLFCAGHSRAPIIPSSLRPLTVRQKEVLLHLWCVVEGYYSAKPSKCVISELMSELESRRLSYAGNDISVRRELNSAKIEAVWPKIGDAAVCDITNHIDPQLADLLQKPRECLKPEAEWPVRTPMSCVCVFGSDAEWRKVVRAAYLRGMMAPVADSDVFRNQLWAMVLNGAMAVDKAKGDEMMQRCICMFAPCTSICVICRVTLKPCR